MTLTKVSGGILDPGINVAGIVTATGFDGPFTGGSSKNITAGIITATGFDLNGNGDISGNLVIGGNLTANGDFTTLNTTLREVEILRVDANSSATAGIITQRGSGNILELYDGTTEKFHVDSDGTTTHGTLQVDGIEGGDAQIRLRADQGDDNNDLFRFLVEDGGKGLKIEGYDGSFQTRLTVDTSGNIGIGSDVPTVKLDVNGTSKFQDLATFTKSGSALRLKDGSILRLGNEDADFFLYHDGSSTDFISAGAGRQLRLTTDDFVVKGANNTKTLMTAAVDGRVNLYYNNVNTAFTDLDAFKVFGRTSNSGMIEIASNQAANNNDRFRIHKTSAASRLTIQNYSTGSWVENIRITAGGAVELKHADGTTKFQTGSTVNINSNHFEITSGQQLRFDNSNNDRSSEILNTGSSGNSTLAFKTNGGTRWTINSSGHLLPGAVGSYDIGSTGAEIGDVYLADDKRLKLGSDQDMFVYHDNIHGYVSNRKANLYVQAPNYVEIGSTDTNGSATQTSARFLRGGKSEIYHSDSVKFETSGTGITVTGEVAASQDYPNFRPTLDLNFAAEKKLDPRITFRREGSGTYYGKDGLVKFASSNEPRFDHDPITRESKGLLIEEQRQNMFPYTTTPGDSGWTSSKAGTFTQNTTETKAPDGTFTATKWTFTSIDPYLYDVQNLAANTAYTLSVWVKAGTNMAGDFLQLRIGGAPYSPFDDNIRIPADGTWTRISYTRTIGGSAENSASIGFEPQTSPSGNPASGDVIYIWGPQLEVGSFPTSYISSNGAHRPLRGADFALIDGEEFTEFFNQDQGTIITSTNSLNTSATQYSMVIEGDNTNNERHIFVEANAYQYQIKDGGSTVAQIDAGSISTKNIIAAAYKLNDTAVSINGSDAATDTSATMPTCTKLKLGHWSTEVYNGHINRFIYYPQRISNTQLRNLTS